jgi:hypothetical protein
MQVAIERVAGEPSRTAEQVVVGVRGLNRDPYAATGDVGRSIARTSWR